MKRGLDHDPYPGEAPKLKCLRCKQEHCKCCDACHQPLAGEDVVEVAGKSIHLKCRDCAGCGQFVPATHRAQAFRKIAACPECDRVLEDLVTPCPECKVAATEKQVGVITHRACRCEACRFTFRETERPVFRVKGEGRSRVDVAFHEDCLCAVCDGAIDPWEKVRRRDGDRLHAYCAFPSKSYPWYGRLTGDSGIAYSAEISWRYVRRAHNEYCFEVQLGDQVYRTGEVGSRVDVSRRILDAVMEILTDKDAQRRCALTYPRGSE